MGALKSAGALLARFILCFALIACLWIVSIAYRIGPFRYDGSLIIGNPEYALADSDCLLLAASLGLLIGSLGLYRSGRISAVLMVLVSLLAITAIDHFWGVYGYVDEYKGLPAHVLKPALAAILISPLAFLFPVRRQASDKLLAWCWLALVVTIFLIGTRMIDNQIFRLQSMIGPTYMQIVFLCLLAPEILRQAKRLRRLANGVDRVTD